MNSYSVKFSVAETLWTQDASFALIALQTGVAMLGSSLGNTIVEKAEEVVYGILSLGWNIASDIQHAAKNYCGFWVEETPARGSICKQEFSKINNHFMH